MLLSENKTTPFWLLHIEHKFITKILDEIN